MFPNLKSGTCRVLTATCFLTLTAAACGSDSGDNDQKTSGQTGENNPTTTGTTGGAGGSKATATAGRGGSGGASATSTGTAGQTGTTTTNNGASSSAGRGGSAASSAGSAGSAGSTTAASAGSSGSTSASAGSAAAGSSGAGNRAAAAGSGGAAGAAGAAGKAAGGAGGKGGAGGAGGARSATDGDQADQSLASMPDPSLVASTGGSCQSYTEPTGGKCGGWYCGVDQATLTKAVDPMAVCGGNVELLCSNAVPTAVASCARTAKTANLTATNDELRPMIRDCVFQDSTIQQGATPECVDCLIDVAACASDNCLTQCLTGDSPGCDSCRKQNNCDQMVFSCGGLPSPI